MAIQVFKYISKFLQNVIVPEGVDNNHAVNLGQLETRAKTDGSNASGSLANTINKTHDALTLGTSNGLGLVGQQLSLIVANSLNSGAMSASDYNKLIALSGIQLEADQANAIIRIKDGNGVVLSSLNVAFLNNEGTTFVYNATNNTLDLVNDYGVVLSTVSVSSFVTNVLTTANWNGTTPSKLDFKDVAGAVLFSVDFDIANIQGLQDALSQITDLFGDLRQYFNDVDVSAGGSFNMQQAFFNLLDPGYSTPTVNVADHNVHGARLVLISNVGGGITNYNGKFIVNGVNVGNVALENGNKLEFVWNVQKDAWREVF